MGQDYTNSITSKFASRVMNFNNQLLYETFAKEYALIADDRNFKQECEEIATSLYKII